MTYELAKKIKDAGFKQYTNDIDADIKSWWTPDGDVIVPTLSELIMACGDGEFQLKRTKMWHAVIQKGDVQNHNWSHALTPEEAVANLWLELHKC